MRGRLQVETVASQVLKGNPLGDPNVRQVPVYLPPSYVENKSKRFPVIYYLAGFCGTGRSSVNYNPWKENVAERLERLILAKKARECILIFPDCFTAYGGSQYLNSSATGRYQDYLLDELVPFFDEKFRTTGSASGRAVMGLSSGGYGAMNLGMRSDAFDHVACHSGDMFFEMCYGTDIPKFVNALEGFGGSARRFTKEFLASKKKYTMNHVLINMIGMSSCYSPNPKNPLGFDLPCDERTGELKDKVWARWKEMDPVEAAPKFERRLKKLKTLYFDCGRKDEFYLHLGARRLSGIFKRLGVRHTYVEHAMGHFDMAERFDESLTLLSRRLGR